MKVWLERASSHISLWTIDPDNGVEIDIPRRLLLEWKRADHRLREIHVEIIKTARANKAKAKAKAQK
jgi:hypothetical protein